MITLVKVFLIILLLTLTMYLSRVVTEAFINAFVSEPGSKLGKWMLLFTLHSAWLILIGLLLLLIGYIIKEKRALAFAFIIGLYVAIGTWLGVGTAAKNAFTAQQLDFMKRTTMSRPNHQDWIMKKEDFFGFVPGLLVYFLTLLLAGLLAERISRKRHS